MADIIFTGKKLKNACIIALCMTGILLLRLSFDQFQNYSSGNEALKKGSYINAIMYFERVLHAHVPFSPLENKARNDLMGLAARFEKEKDYEPALLCYETLRTSRYLTRHFFVPGSRELPFLNDRIASIKAQLLLKDGMVKGFREGYDQQMGIMSKDYSPSVFWSLVAVSAFWAYLGFIALWILRRKGVYVYIFCFAFIVWLTGLYMA